MVCLNSTRVAWVSSYLLAIHRTVDEKTKMETLRISFHQEHL